MLHPAAIGKPEATKQHWLIWVPSYSFNLKLFPILSLGANLEGFYEFNAKLCEC